MICILGEAIVICILGEAIVICIVGEAIVICIVGEAIVICIVGEDDKCNGNLRPQSPNTITTKNAHSHHMMPTTTTLMKSTHSHSLRHFLHELHVQRAEVSTD